jgi:hypothetical protein
MTMVPLPHYWCLEQVELETRCAEKHKPGVRIVKQQSRDRQLQHHNQHETPKHQLQLG